VAADVFSIRAGPEEGQANIGGQALGAGEDLRADFRVLFILRDGDDGGSGRGLVLADNLYGPATHVGIFVLHQCLDHGVVHLVQAVERPEGFENLGARQHLA
jgi:hypothetical protein